MAENLYCAFFLTCCDFCCFVCDRWSSALYWLLGPTHSSLSYEWIIHNISFIVHASINLFMIYHAWIVHKTLLKLLKTNRIHKSTSWGITPLHYTVVLVKFVNIWNLYVADNKAVTVPHPLKCSLLTLRIFNLTRLLHLICQHCGRIVQKLSSPI